MADITTLPDASTHAYDIAQSQASEARSKRGDHVQGAAAAAALTAPVVGDTLGTASPNNAVKSVAHTDAPMLPDPTGNVATPAATMRVVKGSDVFAGGGDGVFAALEAMSDARQKDINSAMLVKRVQGADQVTAKKLEMLDKQDQIHGDQKAADVKLMGSMLGLGVTGYMTFSGAKAERAPVAKTNKPAPTDMPSAPAQAPDAKPSSASAPDKEQQNIGAENKAQDDATPTANVKADKKDDDKKASDRQAWGATRRNIGMNASSTVDAAVNMLDMTAGGQAQSNAAQVAQKQDAVQGQIFQNNADSAGAWLDNAKDQRKSAQQAIMTHVQMWGDAANSVWK